MTVRQMTVKDRPAAANLWLTIFGDTESFTDWYFTDRFCPEYSFAVFDADRMIAMTLGRPSLIRVGGVNRNALLISGVCTVPQYRGQGLMHKVMEKQIAYAKESGFACCFLYPVSEGLYASLGFQNGTDMMVIESGNQPDAHSFFVREGIDLPAMRAVYNAMLKTHDGMVVRDEQEISLLLKDFSADGYRMLTAYSENQPQGYLILLSDGTVSELLALCPDAYKTLLNEAAKFAGTKLKTGVPTDCGVAGTLHYGTQYLIFNDAFRLPLKNGFCRLVY